MVGKRNFKGFATLQTPHELLEKVRHDYQRLRSDPEDVYAAFDFFVSAHHMLDWLHPNDKRGRDAEEGRNLLLQVCSHIANGAKHFEATAKEHTSVADLSSVEGAFQRDAFQSDAFQVGGLFVELDGLAAQAFGTRLEVVDLANKVLAHWEGDARLRGHGQAATKSRCERLYGILSANSYSNFTNQ